MARVAVSTLADADVAQILTYLEQQGGSLVAYKYADLFDRLYDRLADQPSSGPPRPRLGSGIRIGIVSPFIVIYRYDATKDVVTVLRVVHGRRRITGTLLSASKP